MKEKTILVVITILFLITGSLLLFSALNEYSFGGDDICIFNGVEYMKGEEIERYMFGSKCVCGSGGLVDCVPLENGSLVVDSEDFVADASVLENEGLEFEYTYITGIAKDVLHSISPLEFKSVTHRDGDLIVILEELQSCPNPNQAPEQVGFFKREGNSFDLHNMVRPATDSSAIDCLVQLKYVFEDIKDFDFSKLSIRFIDESGVAISPSFCFYDDKVYFDRDVFQNTRGDVCICQNGFIECK